jgi:hypothetical protein
VSTKIETRSLPAQEPASGRLVAMVLAPSAVAVAVLLLVLRMHVQPMKIPPYAISPPPADGAPIDVKAGTQFSLAIEPRGPLTGAVMARAFLMQGNAARPWEPQFLVDKDGTIHVAGPVDTLFAGVPAGEWELDVIVGRPEMLPQSTADALKGRDAPPGASAWALVHERIRLSS